MGTKTRVCGGDGDVLMDKHIRFQIIDVKP
jgi:hypothetical protein